MSGKNYSLFFPAALAAAQRFFAAAAIALRAAALILRFGFRVIEFSPGVALPLSFAHRARCAAAIRALPAADMPPRRPRPLDLAAV